MGDLCSVRDAKGTNHGWLILVDEGTSGIPLGDVSFRLVIIKIYSLLVLL